DAVLDGSKLGWSDCGQRCSVRGQVHAAMVILGGGGGREIHAAAATQYVGGGDTECCPLRDYWGRQMGRDLGPCRSALSAPDRHRRAQVLALCRERRTAAAVWSRAAEAAARGGAHRRYDRIQCLGPLPPDLHPHPPGASPTPSPH